MVDSVLKTRTLYGLLACICLGCSDGRPTEEQEREDIQAGREAVEQIRKDPSIPPNRKQAMIERIELEVREQTGEPVELQSPPER